MLLWPFEQLLLRSQRRVPFPLIVRMCVNSWLLLLRIYLRWTLFCQFQRLLLSLLFHRCGNRKLFHRMSRVNFRWIQMIVIQKLLLNLLEIQHFAFGVFLLIRVYSRSKIECLCSYHEILSLRLLLVSRVPIPQRCLLLLVVPFSGQERLLVRNIKRSVPSWWLGSVLMCRTWVLGSLRLLTQNLSVLLLLLFWRSEQIRVIDRRVSSQLLISLASLWLWRFS